MAERESLSTKLQRALLQVQAGQTWTQEQSASPRTTRPPLAKQSDAPRAAANSAFQRGLDASYPNPLRLPRTLSVCSLSHPKQELASHPHVAGGQLAQSQAKQVWIQQPPVLGGPNTTADSAVDILPAGARPESQTSRTGALYHLRRSLSDDLEQVGSESYARSASLWSSDSPRSYEDYMNMETGEIVCPPDDGGNGEQSETNAYIAQWLSGSGLDRHHVMLTDLLAYQVSHSYAEMANSMASGMKLGLASAQDAKEDSWMAVHLTAPLPHTAGPELGDREEVLSSETPSQGTSSHAEVDSWMSSLMNSSSTFSADIESTFEQELEQEHEQAPQSLDDVTAMLLELGEAVVADDPNAPALVRRLEEYSSPYGAYLQRLAHYFTRALMAKLNGTGADLFTAIKRDRPSVLETAKALKFFLSTDPTLALAHHFSNSVLLEAFEGADRVHIIDYGIQNGHQWPILMQTLADRPAGPPRLRITGIEFPQPGLNPDGMVKETGRRLARFAASLKIPFEYKAISAKWEDVQVSSLDLREEETLAVSSVFRLRHLLDDSVVLSNPRRTVLERIRSMNPRVVITSVLSMAGNAPFLVTRLRESIPFFARYFDAFESCTTPLDTVDRQIMEREMLGREILNMIACEGIDRRERPEAYYQWHWRLMNAGFESLPVKESLFMSTRDILKYYHEDWTVGYDNGWILSGWKRGVQHASAAWRPACFS